MVRTTTRRVGRPTTAPKPAQKSVLNIAASPELKERLIEASRVSARSLSAEMEMRLEQSFSGGLGGPRIRALFELLASVAHFAFPDESWLVDRERWDITLRLFSETLDSRAPPAKSLEEMIASARRMIDRLRTTTDRTERGQLKWIASNLVQDQRLPVHVRDELWSAAIAVEPISIDEQIAAGRELVQRLQVTHDPVQREHLRELLASMAQIASLDDETREEFRVAAVSPPPPPVIAETWTPSPPASEEVRAEELAHFTTAWKLARLTAIVQLGVAEPSPEAIAQIFAADVELVEIIAGLEAPTTAAWILAKHAQFEKVKVTTARWMKQPAPAPTGSSQ